MSKLLKFSIIIGELLLIVAVTYYASHFIGASIGHHGDLLGRVVNLENLRHTGNIYLPFGTQAFTYPPGAILLLWPLMWIPLHLLAFAWTLGSLLALIGTVFITQRYVLKQELMTVSISACAIGIGSIFLFPSVRDCLGWGQTSTFIMFAVMLDWLIVRGKSQGVLLGLMAALKLYPVIFILVWLLRRQWQAAVTALATFTVITMSAVILWPASASTYVSKVLFGGNELKHFLSNRATISSSSFSSMLNRAPFHIGEFGSIGAFVGSLFVVVLGLYAAQNLWKRSYEFSSAVVILITSIIGAPVAWDHYFTYAPILIFVALEVGMKSWTARTALLNIAALIVPWNHWRSATSTSWMASFGTYVSRNSITLASLALLTAALLERSTHSPAD